MSEEQLFIIKNKINVSRNNDKIIKNNTVNWKMFKLKMIND